MTPEEAERLLAWKQILANQEREATRTSGKLFMQVFLKHYCTEASPGFHDEMIGLCLKEPPYDKEWEGKEGLVIAAPRGHGKSTIVSLLTPLFEGCHKRKKFCVMISDTDRQAESLADSLRREFEDNDRLRDVFGNLRGDRFKTDPFRWTNQDFTIAHTNPIDSVNVDDVVATTRYLAKGMMTRIRGARTRQARPDLLILDDCENDENIATPEQRTKTWLFLFKALLPMLDPKGGTFIAAGTILHHESLLNKLLLAERVANQYA